MWVSIHYDVPGEGQNTDRVASQPRKAKRRLLGDVAQLCKTACVNVRGTHAPIQSVLKAGMEIHRSDNYVGFLKGCSAIEMLHRNQDPEI